ncbi:hypothetical protein WA538_005914 [Blastocystis sp. DL]
MSCELCFKLDESFLDKYKTLQPPFGYAPLGELVYRRTYSRTLEDGSKEDWWQTVRRVVEGTYSLQKEHIQAFRLGWDDEHGQRSAQEMYDLIFNMKFLPPGRGLWVMGTPVIHKKNLSAALNNCAFVSTEDLELNPTRPFEFLMDASMLGVGVGFDTKGRDRVMILGPKEEVEVYRIEDSREGWVNSVSKLLKAYFGVNGEKMNDIEFDYSAIRPEGEPLKTFGGVSSGPRPLRELHESIRGVLNGRIGQRMDSRAIVDLFNLIGRCVVSGNVRRSAEIAFGDPDDITFMDLKDYDKNPERAAFGWSSNNSIFARVGMDYTEVAKRLRVNGEPGLAWLENMQKFGRMEDGPNWKDKRVKGGNPCLEQSLESYELCCLVETFPARHASLSEYLRTLKFAYLYAKTVTLRMTHWPETNRVMLRNRRIGCSVSGIADFLGKHNLEELRQWLDEGYRTVQRWDEVYSNWFCIPRSIKTTSVKPSGTVSLLAGATPGMHFPESRIYIRRMRMSKNDPLAIPLRAAGYSVVPAIGQEDTTVVVEMPIKLAEGVRVQSEVSMFEQLQLAAFLQRYWADNQVSCTITFDPVSEGPHIAQMLQYFQYQLKGVSFLPKFDYSKYPQLPYEAIGEELYEKMTKDLKPIVFVNRAKVSVKKGCESPKKTAQRNKFIVRLGEKEEANDEETAPCEGGEGVGQVFPDAIAFCTNDHCQL